MKANSLNLKPERKENNLNYWLTKIPKNIQPTGIRLDFRRPVDYLENTGELSFQNDATKVICLDYEAEKEKIAGESVENCVTATTVNDLCYVIFTSGSTGVPKGACVYHKGWTNLLYWFTKEFEINSGDKNLIVSSFSFDLTQRAMAMSLINGGELHLVNANHYDPDLIINTIADQEITLLNCAPSAIYPLIENNEDALPIPGVSTAGKDKTEIGEMEEVLIKTFADTLKVETIGVDDNFFQIGGYSLLVTQIVSIASQAFNVELTQTDFLTNPTVRGFAQRIRQNQSKMKGTALLKESFK
jgi:acyl-CoA synthetase (AMP-forming)/AMP-acid ligase II